MGRFILRYEWIHFRRNRLQVSLLVILFAFGLYAIYYGNRQINRQRAALTLAGQQSQAEWTGYQVAFRADTTKADAKRAYQLAADPAFAWWRHPYLARLNPAVLAPLAVGQRDLNPGFYQLTGMSLYYRLFQTELANPLKLLVGNFDLSFVLVYLLPLFIIALGFSLLSGEQESGVLPLLHVQAASIRRVLVYKLLFAFGLVTGLALLLSLLGFVAANVHIGRDIGVMTYWLLTVIGYSSFWFGIIWLIVAFNQSSAINALVSVGLWLLFLLVIPSLLSAYVSVVQPIDSSGLATLARRESIPNETDADQMRAIVRRYARQNPGLTAPGDTLYEPNLFPKAYAAFSQINDAKHRPVVARYWQLIETRHALANRFSLINPAVNAQELLSSCAQTDLPTYLSFLRSLPEFHGQIASFYLSRLFKNQAIHLYEYEQRPAYHQSANEVTGSIWRGLAYLFGSAIVLLVIGWFVAISRI